MKVKVLIQLFCSDNSNKVQFLKRTQVKSDFFFFAINETSSMKIIK